MAEVWPKKLAMPPTLPTLWRSVMRSGTDQRTGAAVARPPSERLIEARAMGRLEVRPAPRRARPQAVPPRRTERRTWSGLRPPRMRGVDEEAAD